MIDNDTIKNTEEEFTSLFSANFYSIIFFISKIINIFEKQNKGYIVGFGSISAALGRDINIGYSCAKSALENYFEGLIISNLKTKINIQFYTLGYLDTNLSSVTCKISLNLFLEALIKQLLIISFVIFFFV